MVCKFKSWLGIQVSSISALNKAVGGGGQVVVLYQEQGLKGSINTRGYSGRTVSISLSYSNHVNVHIPKTLHIYSSSGKSRKIQKKRDDSRQAETPLFVGAQGRSRTGTVYYTEGF